MLLPIHTQVLYLVRDSAVEIPKFSSAYLSGSFPSIGTSSSPLISGSQNQPTVELWDSVSFQGDGTGLIMTRSETTDRMQAVLGRLDEASGRYLMSSELLQDEVFLTFAEGLSDTDLKNFAHTVKGLRTPPDQQSTFIHLDGGITAIKELFEDLQSMSGGTLSRVLEKTAELSAPIPAYDANPTYDGTGGLPPGSAAATPLHNFVQAIGTMESVGIDEQANSLLDTIELYDEELESTLLQIASADSNVAVKIMTQMQDYSGATQDDVFTYLAELSSSISPYRFYSSEGDDGIQGYFGVDILSNSKEVIVDMMGTFSSLMENYQLSDAQITDMTTGLTELDNENQRSYLQITESGLDTLLRKNGNEKQLSIPIDALTIVDNLRNDSSVRMLVSESGFGDKHVANDGQIAYDLKSMSAGKQDKAQVIEVLTTHAWLNRESSSNSHLANALSSLNAEQRDSLIDDLSSLNDQPLYNLSPDETEGYKTLQQRLDVISNTNDLPALLAAKEKLPDESVESFWSATSFLEQESDKFVEMINRSNTEGAQVLVGLIVSLEESIEHEEMTYEEAIERAQDILNAFQYE